MRISSIMLGSLLVFVTSIGGQAVPRVFGWQGVDLDGRPVRLDRRSGLKGMAIVFLGTECPISNRYVPALNELALFSAARGIDLIGVVSSAFVTRAAARAHRDRFEIRFRVVFDGAGSLARLLQPTHVPEAFVFDARGSLVYRGRIDDTWVELGVPRAEPTSRDLADVVRDLADGGVSVFRRTTPVGCAFELPSLPSASAGVTYSRHIAPILRARCTGCHGSHGQAPFPLTTYASAAKRARSIATVTASRTMPPFAAAHGYAAYRNENRLTDDELEMLSRWADAGAPRGDPADLPPAPDSAEARWPLGTPDVVLHPAQVQTIAPSGIDRYHADLVPLSLDRDREIVAVHYRPGAPSVVHHAIFVVVHHGRVSPFGGYCPGSSTVLPPRADAGMPVSRDAKFGLLTHYYPDGRKHRDRWEVGLYFAKKPVRTKIRWLALGVQDIDIPPGARRHRIHGVYRVTAPLRIHELLPHMHLIGREIRIDAFRPDGTRVPLVWIPRWDFNWQQRYELRDPVDLPAGSRIELTAFFDNSTDNPRNPNRPPRRIRVGPSTRDEMCECYIQVTTASDEDFEKLRAAEVEMRAGAAALGFAGFARQRR